MVAYETYNDWVHRLSSTIRMFLDENDQDIQQIADWIVEFDSDGIPATGWDMYVESECDGTRGLDKLVTVVMDKWRLEKLKEGVDVAKLDLDAMSTEEITVLLERPINFLHSTIAAYRLAIGC